MPNISIRTIGLDHLFDVINKLPKDIIEEIGEEFVDYARRVSAIQKRKAPKDQGGLVRNIGIQFIERSNGPLMIMFANSEHSGYLEFGTKKKVDHGYISKYNLQDVASKMRGPGIRTSISAREAIYAWCKRVGIKKKLWNLIFLEIMHNGIKPQHFFYEPIYQEQKELTKRILNIIEQER